MATDPYEEFRLVVPKIVADEAKLDAWINGGENDTVQTSGGPIPTWRGIVKSIETQATDQVNEIIVAGGQIFPDESTGRAAVQDGQYYYAESSDQGVAKAIWQRIDSGSSRLVAEEPSSEAVNDVVAQQDEIRVKTDQIDPNPALGVEFAVEDSQGRAALLIDELGRTRLIELLFNATIMNDAASSPGSVFAITDDNGRAALNVGDDGVTQLMGMSLRQALFTDSTASPGVEFAITDDQGRSVVELESDGTLAVRNLRADAADIDGLNAGGDIEYAGSQIMPNSSDTDRYVRGSEVLPVSANMTRISGFGSSSMMRFEPYFSPVATEFGATYFDGGKGGERSDETAARIGSIPALLTFPGNTIPGSGSVAVDCSNVEERQQLKMFNGFVNGTRGRLEFSGAEDSWIFTRNPTGDPVPMPPDSPMVPEYSANIRDSVAMLWMGKNDTSALLPAEDIIRRTDASFDWFSSLYKRCIVLGHYVNRNVPEVDARRDLIYAVNDAYEKRYGLLYIDVQAYLMSQQVWDDTGITPTQADLDNQAIGNLPPSLTDDGMHMNDAAYTAFTQIVRQKFIDLTWYTEPTP